MIESIAFVRDLVIILSGIIITITVLVVGVAFMDLVRKGEALCADVETSVISPIKAAWRVIRKAWLSGRLP